MKRILKSRDKFLRLSLLMAPWTKVLYTIDTHLSLSVKPLHQHYFPADDERSFGEDGERVGEELLRGMGRWGERYRVESYRVESYVVESGTTKKRAPKISLQSSLILKKAATYSPALHCSTIGADGLNFSVRNGKR